MLQNLVVHGIKNTYWTADLIKDLKLRDANFEWITPADILNHGKNKEAKDQHHYLRGVE